MDYDKLKCIVEAALFSNREPLTLNRLMRMFADAPPERDVMEQVLSMLDRDYAARGVELARSGNAYWFRTRGEYTPWLQTLVTSRPPRYSRALLETLAIIAYRQPVTRADIEEIRGVSVTTEIVRTLLDREWIRQIGTRDVPGRPALYGTTRAFLEYFHLESLKDLPPLQDERDLTIIARELEIALPDPGEGGESGDGGETGRADGADFGPDAEDAPDPVILMSEDLDNGEALASEDGSTSP